MSHLDSNHVAGHIGRVVTAEALGQTWKFSRWTRSVWVEFAKRAKDLLPDPVAVVMKSIDAVALKDAEIMRGLIKADMREEKEAKEEKRPPVLMAPKFKPISDMLVEKALDKATSYLAFNSLEMSSCINSVPGMSTLLFLLLRDNHPEIDEDKAQEIAEAMGKDEVERVFRTTAGEARAVAKNA